MIRTRVRATQFLAAALLAPDASAGAQAAEMPQSGARVRVTTPFPAIDRRPAQLVARRGDTLHLLVRGRRDTVAVPLSAVTRLEVSRGRWRPWLRNGFLGIVTGAAVGVAGAALFVENETDCGQFSFGCGEEKGWAMAGLGILGGIVGGVAGIAIGISRPVDRWESIPLSHTPGRLGLRRAGGRVVTFSLAVAF